MNLGYLLVIVAVAALLWLANGIRRIGAVSHGPLRGNHDGTAILLVDLQSVFWDNGPYSTGAKQSAKSAILHEVDTARAKGQAVIAIRQEWSIPSTKVIARLAMKGQAIKGSAGTELAAPFAQIADHVLVKRVQDAFETKELGLLLDRLGVGNLRIVGLDLNHCVQKTALAAASRGYDVVVVKAGTLSAAPSERTEQRLVSKGVSLQ